jgi:hypothetical protein
MVFLRVTRKLFGHLVLFISTLMVASCSSYFVGQVNAVAIITHYPTNYYLDKSNPVINILKDTLIIFFFDKSIIYKLSPTANFKTEQNISGTEHYFIRNRFEKFGYLFESLHDQTHSERFEADSFIVNNALGGLHFEYPKEQDGYKLSSSVEDSAKSLRIEKFSKQSKLNDESPDTIFYYYSRVFPKTEYSFSKNLDSIKGMKLFKMRIFFNAGFSVEKKMFLPAREMLFQLQPIESGVSKEVWSLYDRFKKNGHKVGI